ncbi:hypothetical protein ACGTN6_20700, partial [Halomonas sp. THAF12]|uniref:hypothetical protein n=1 Tax=Halomonas sp. B23F22_10 TaxID=3459515 RepID=UPI00373F1042
MKDELEAEVHILTQAGRDMEQRYNAKLLSMADILLRPHRDKKNLVPHIRWRDRAMRRMGDHLFESAM